MENNKDFGLLSIITPVFNEEETLKEFHFQVSRVLKTLNMKIEFIYINDGSSDASFEILKEFQNNDHRVGIVDLSRNYGKEIALSAGLDFVNGDAVVIIDADLQDPPELILKFVEKWRSGYDVVYGKRINRRGETKLKKVTSHFFYRFIQRLSRIRIPEDTGDFRLLSRRAVIAMRRFKEHHRFMKGLFSWIGFSQVPVLYERAPRYAGKTKFCYWKLWNFALEGITSFSSIPLQFSMYLGCLIAIGSFCYAIKIVIKTLLFGDPVAGYPSMMTAILFMGGIQLISLGVIGEYLGRIFNETKNRPLYLINQYKPSIFDSDMNQIDKTM